MCNIFGRWLDIRDFMGPRWQPYGYLCPLFSPLLCVLFLMHHVSQVLRFYGHFRQDIQLSPSEEYRVRPVLVYYYLMDDTMCITEPEVENSGMPQGKLVRRERLPKSRADGYYHWKDLNLGMDLCVYGTTYRLASCDAYTRVNGGHVLHTRTHS